VVPAPARLEGREVIMALKQIGMIAIPDSKGSSFDHGAFDAKTRRVFVAHTGRSCVEVIDHDAGRHIATLAGFPEAAGVVADDGQVLVTNRGSASLSWIDAKSLAAQGVFDTGPRPNGVGIVPRLKLAIAACIGDDVHRPELRAFYLDDDQKYALNLTGPPRWCVTDAAATRLFLAIREPSMVLVAKLPGLDEVTHWPLPVGGAHGLEIDHRDNRLFVACDDRAVVEVDARSGGVLNTWPIAGGPDVTFVNPATGLVHVAIGKPGLVQSIDPRSGASTQTLTSPGAHTTAIVAPDRLYVFSPVHGGALVYEDA
jgi:DNA-binding beta-propeller fold protein YncE